MPRELKRKRSASPVQHIPRPANPFIIFRSDKLKNSVPKPTLEGCGRQKQKDISREAAAAWKNIDPILKQLYGIQAKLIKDEHAKKYPGWVYRPKVAKKKGEKSIVVDDDCPHTKSIARATTPCQMSSTDAEGEGRLVAAHSTRDTAPTEIVWDSSWFSRSGSMADPFYSTLLQPLTSSSLVPPPMAPTLSSIVQMNGFGTTSNVHAVPSVYNSNPGLENGGPHNADPFSDEVLTPESEPPTQGLMQNSELSYENLFGGFHYDDDWGINLAFNPDSDPSLTMGF